MAAIQTLEVCGLNGNKTLAAPMNPAPIKSNPWSGLPTATSTGNEVFLNGTSAVDSGVIFPDSNVLNIRPPALPGKDLPVLNTTSLSARKTGQPVTRDAAQDVDGQGNGDLGVGGMGLTGVKASIGTGQSALSVKKKSADKTKAYDKERRRSARKSGRSKAKSVAGVVTDAAAPARGVGIELRGTSASRGVQLTPLADVAGVSAPAVDPGADSARTAPQDPVRSTGHSPLAGTSDGGIITGGLMKGLQNPTPKPAGEAGGGAKGGKKSEDGSRTSTPSRSSPGQGGGLELCGEKAKAEAKPAAKKRATVATTGGAGSPKKGDGGSPVKGAKESGRESWSTINFELERQRVAKRIEGFKRKEEEARMAREREEQEKKLVIVRARENRNSEKERRRNEIYALNKMLRESESAAANEFKKVLAVMQAQKKLEQEEKQRLKLEHQRRKAEAKLRKAAEREAAAVATAQGGDGAQSGELSTSSTSKDDAISVPAAPSTAFDSTFDHCNSMIQAALAKAGLGGRASDESVDLTSSLDVPGNSEDADGSAAPPMVSLPMGMVHAV